MNSIDTVKCLMPFTDLIINVKGYSYSCPSAWTIRGNIGSLGDKNKTIMDIWNSDRIQYMRKAILENKREKVCNFKGCHIAIKNKEIHLDQCKGNDQYNAIIEQIKQGKTKLDTAPYSIGIATSGVCNLRCIMCDSNEKYLPNNDDLDEKLYTKLIPEILPNISILQLTGNGDVFYNKHSRKFLQTLDSSKYPSLKIKFITNGNLFTPKMWETIKHNNFDGINVSIDAATKETYEKVRVNGKWDLLMNNLELISDLKQKKVFGWFVISFVVLKSNYTEIKKFAELGIKLGCDTVLFQSNHSPTNLKENLNITRDRKILSEVARILEDPIFERADVDTTLIDEYRKYGKLKSNFADKLSTKIKEYVFHPIIKVCSIKTHFFLDFSEFYKNMVRPLYYNKLYGSRKH